ncbi:hypothetical protein M9H77_26504 [Catharanthus roseus]|uniref:Uncharacterized protein n=1 Tax=Catharanthus roseus TaxID=4058 RepID=A0ACC0AAV2_CATRO|nr:hypothetical protein M9H77_26504 [Catharanthus roseus]
MRHNIAKLYHAIKFQRWLGKAESIEYFSKARHDKIEPESDPVESDPDKPISIPPVDPKYISWLKEHPSALLAFPGMMSTIKGKQIVVFLDYDGTLTPIVDDPERAFMSDAMRIAVRDVARHFPTAIISGRSRRKVYEFIKLDEVYYAGSHGMDIMGPSIQLDSYECKYRKQALDKQGNEVTIFQPAREFLPAIQEMLSELKEITIGIPGVFIEDNRFCISVHYRHVKDNDYPTLENKVLSVLGQHSGFHLTKGKKVFEIRPSIKWNKGNALVYLLDTLGFAANSNNVVPIYIGDDKTDEDAFKVLKSGGVGYPIIVSSTPRQTLASSSLRDPSEVLSFLIRLARWGEENSSQ